MKKVKNPDGGRKVSPHTIYTDCPYTNEDKLTLALLHIIKTGGIDLLISLGKELQLPIKDNYLEVVTQRDLKLNSEDPYSRCDGLIIMEPFQLLIESKLEKNAINLKQLKNYKNYLLETQEKGVDIILLYITPDERIPKSLKEEEGVSWISWNDIFSFLKEYCNKHIELNNLFKGFEGLYNQLFKHFIKEENLVAILPANLTIDSIVKKHRYSCQNHRSFNNANYLAFYADKKIEYLFKIKDNYINNGNYDKIPINDQVFELIPVKNIIKKPILNKELKDGKIVPFTMGQPRYCSIEDLQSVEDTTQLNEIIKNRK